MQGKSYYLSFLRVEEEGTELGFRRRGGHEFEDCAVNEDGAVEADGFTIFRHGSHEKMATCATLRPFDREVGCVGMDIEDHVGGMESYRGVRMGGKIVEELVSIFDGVFCRLRLLRWYR